MIAAGLLALAGSAAILVARGASAAGPTKPNIVVILTDDQRLDDLYAKIGHRQLMPRTRRLIGRNGVTFKRMYATYPLSCPSRTTILTGRYAHNHNIVANIMPHFGYCGRAKIWPRHDDLPIWLQRVGYYTIITGRYLNGYPGRHVPRRHMDPGWNRWVVPVETGDSHAAVYFNYRLNINGKVSRKFGGHRLHDPRVYFTDVITQYATRYIDQAPDDQPIFLYLAHRAPHEDVPPPVGPEPSPRDEKGKRKIAIPHPPGYDEANVSDKPQWVRNEPPLTAREKRQATHRARRRRACLRAVDRSVETVIKALAADGRLDNTYIFFLSDNGFFLGEHRFPKGKVRAYEPSTHVPLMVSGPGIPHGKASSELVGNIDIAPTILKLAGATATRPIDGRSLLPFLLNPSKRTRRPILLEAYRAKPGRGQAISGAASRRDRGTRAVAAVNGRTKAPNYQAIVFGRYKLVRYIEGRELYDLKRDPYELHNLYYEPRYYPVGKYLKRKLHRLGSCAGDGCRRPIKPVPRPRGAHRARHGR